MIFLLLLLLVGCASTQPITVDVEPAPAFDMCEPARGEDQEVTVLIRGKGYDTVTTGCI